MTSVQFLGTSGTQSATGSSFGFPYQLPITGLTLFSIGVPTANPVTAMSMSVGGTATFLRLGGAAGNARQVDLWLAYNFQMTGQANITPTFAGGGSAAFAWINLCVDADLSIAAPTAVLSTGQTGNSTIVDSGSVTPNTGDLLFAGGVWSVAAGSSSRTSTGYTFINNKETFTGAIFSAAIYASALGTTSSRLQWTISSASAWDGLLASITLPSPQVPAASFVYKGRDNNTDDAGTVP